MLPLLRLDLIQSFIFLKSFHSQNPDKSNGLGAEYMSQADPVRLASGIKAFQKTHLQTRRGTGGVKRGYRGGTGSVQ